MKNSEKFVEWWKEIEPDLLRFAGSLVGHEKKDLVQEVSLMAVMRFDDFHELEAFRRWALIRVNWLALDVLARQQRTEKGSQEIIDALSVNMESDTRDWLLSMIERLPGRRRIVVERRLMGYSSREVAALMGIEESTVRSLWRHAKKRLVTFAMEEGYASK